MTRMAERKFARVKGGHAGPSTRQPLRYRLTPWLLLTPMMVMVLVALGYPLVRQTVMSFQHFGLAQQFGQPAEWAGISNYKRILTDPYFWQVFAKSIGFCLWTASITMLLGVILAVLMLRLCKPVRMFVNFVLIIVWAMPHLASLTVWQWLVDTRSGLVNFLLTAVGFDKFHNFNWLGGSYWTFYLVASAVVIWQSLPLVTITIHAALAQMPTDVLEASAIDGATRLQQITKIMLPIISPVIALIGVLQVIWDLRVFTHIYVLQQSSGIVSETNLLGTYVYETGISQGNYGVASALAMVVLILTLILTFNYLRMLYRQGDVD